MKRGLRAKGVDEGSSIRVRRRSGRQEVEMIGHETVRNYFYGLCLRRSLKLSVKHRRDVIIRDVGMASERAPREEDANGACVFGVVELVWAAMTHGTTMSNP